MARQRSDIYTRMLGLRDNVADGLFNPDTGELRPGFPVTAEDVVVDVGCGGAIDSIFCAEQGAHVIYVDSNPDEVAIAGTRLANAGARELTPIVSDANPLPLTDGIATRVIASEVLEHVDDPQQFLRELVRVGAPNALFLLAVPDPAAEELQTRLAPPIYFQKPNHVRIIGRSEFARMVTDAGLIIERRGAYGFYWSIWWILFWICRVDISEPHPLLESWSKTWETLLDMPNGGPARRALNELLPKSQYIVARKAKRIRLIATIRKLLAGKPAARTQTVAPVSSSHADDCAAASGAPPATDDADRQTIAFHDVVRSAGFDFDQKEIFSALQISDDDAVLDAGCGHGDYSVICGMLGANLTAIDPDPENVAIAARRMAESGVRSFTTLVGGTRPLPLPSANFTKIIAMESLGRDSDPAVFLEELVRVGRPGARYLLSVQDAVQDGLQRRIAPREYFADADFGERTFRGLPCGQIRSFGRDEFERMVLSAGLVVERVESYGFYWALWSIFFWVCNVNVDEPRHPLLAPWAHTWKLVLDSPDGHRVAAQLDNFMPRNRIIVARKP